MPVRGWRDRTLTNYDTKETHPRYLCPPAKSFTWKDVCKMTANTLCQWLRAWVFYVEENQWVPQSEIDFWPIWNGTRRTVTFLSLLVNNLSSICLVSVCIYRWSYIYLSLISHCQLTSFSFLAWKIYNNEQSPTTLSQRKLCQTCS